MANNKMAGQKRPFNARWDVDTLGDEECTESFLKSIRLLYGTGEYSDFSIVCGGRTYHMHKVVVCPRSPVFAAMLRSSFKKSRIDLAEDDVLAVHCMIRYFYFHNYIPEHQAEDAGFDGPGAVQTPAAKKKAKGNARKSTGTAAVAAMLPPAHHAIKLHAEVYILADRYDIDGLKELALFKFRKSWVNEWDTKAIVAAARIAYEWTTEIDRGLRDSVVDAMYAHHATIFQDASCKEELQGIGSLMYDLASRMSGIGTKVAQAANTAQVAQAANTAKVAQTAQTSQTFRPAGQR